MSLIKGYNLLKKMGAYMPRPYDFLKKAQKVKAIALDWDGVFTSGEKDSNGHSSFSEADSMGLNLLRYGYALHHKAFVRMFIITGQQNPTATFFTNREHIDGMFFNIKNKKEVLPILHKEYGIIPENLLFVYDDVLDLSLAKLCLLKIMVKRNASAIFSEYIRNNAFADYITASQGGENALRECSELLLNTLQNFQEVIENRVNFSKSYQEYINLRNLIKPSFYTPKHDNHRTICEVKNLQEQESLQ